MLYSYNIDTVFYVFYGYWRVTRGVCGADPQEKSDGPVAGYTLGQRVLRGVGPVPLVCLSRGYRCRLCRGIGSLLRRDRSSALTP